MCGVFGIAGTSNSRHDISDEIRNFKELGRLSSRRGGDASGLILANETTTRLLTTPRNFAEVGGEQALTRCISDFKSEMNRKELTSRHYILIGHTRLSTHGQKFIPENNQPIGEEGIYIIHNGIVMLLGEEEFKEEKDKSDSYLILDFFLKNRAAGNDIKQSLANINREIAGSINLAVFLEQSSELLLWSNTGDLYFHREDTSRIIFGSEKYFLNAILTKSATRNIQQVPINQLVSFNCLEKNDKILRKKQSIKFQRVDFGYVKSSNLKATRSSDLEKYLHYPFNKVNKLRRCVKCILPETFPGIAFNPLGECQLCENYQKKIPIGAFELKKQIDKKLRESKTESILVPFSGGRDSSFMVHFLRNELNYDIVTFSYDWGLITDQARINVSTICANLGIRNILVAPNVSKKRENAGKNLKAYARKPNIGMVPILMAGDKAFFRILNQIKKNEGLNVNVWGTNRLEETLFKTGYARLTRYLDRNRIDKLTGVEKISLLTFYLKEFCRNWHYINSSLIDSMLAYQAYYFEERTDYFLFYDYVGWDEKLIEKTLSEKYGLEIGRATRWRMGDATAPLYNYLYFNYGGFTEFDTFRSNQIRQGLITREEALELIQNENRPDLEGLRDYFNMLDVNGVEIFKSLAFAPTLLK